MRSDSYGGRRKCRLWEDICGRENNDPAYWRWDSDSSGKARDDLWDFFFNCVVLWKIENQHWLHILTGTVPHWPSLPHGLLTAAPRPMVTPACNHQAFILPDTELPSARTVSTSLLLIFLQTTTPLSPSPAQSESQILSKTHRDLCELVTAYAVSCRRVTSWSKWT